MKAPAAVLAQLPVPDLHSFYTEGNIPVAAGYLKANAVENLGFDADDIRILPREVADFGGDAGIADWIASSGAGVVGWTCYMWNVERQLTISERLKAANPDIRIVLGGPELDERHPALTHPAVDAIVLGEGEAAFGRILRDMTWGGRIDRLFREGACLDPARIPNPYLSGSLKMSRGETVFFETMRGCPHRCSYCYYSKNQPSVRIFPDDRLRRMFAAADTAGCAEIYLMDPSFHAAPGLLRRLEHIKQWNRTRIPIHTELRLERIDPPTADALRDAGVRSVEAGLQSTNPRALTAVHREWDRRGFVRGAGLLRERGIAIRTGVILGLPFDTPSTIRDTVDFVIELGLQDDMEFYPLSILPGTRLRDEAEVHRMKHMDAPPYWILSHPDLKPGELSETIIWIEDTLGIDFFPAFAPAREPGPERFTAFADLRKRPEAVLERMARTPRRLANRLTLLMRPDTPFPPLRDFGERLRGIAPHTLVQIVVEAERTPPPGLSEKLKQAFDFGPRYFDRIHHFMVDPQNTFSLRLYHLTGNPEEARKALVTPRPYDLILRYGPGLREDAPDLLEDHPILWVESGVPKEERDMLRGEYRAFPHLLLFPRDRTDVAWPHKA